MFTIGLKEYINKIKKDFLDTKENYIDTPDFNPSEEVRNHIIFSGKVQSVGFRFETSQVAKALDLKGWVKNNPDGTVESEIQGEKDKIKYLINHMESLQRADVTNVEIKEIPLEENEEDFQIVM